ncbi:EpsG family protein [Treponema sp. Marseille-Q4132]|uniref:EpsG family protein n=1 Tax=Treponema sp. Marseille-Q4132 TaxID=2766701 RepID=UPI001652E07D|nr:EpsG family protein [Treponema sp. Marseille-Q4132]QNL97863.1 EpsG family protein [Treponema sp. Marseille-Q4132]
MSFLIIFFVVVLRKKTVGGDLTNYEPQFLTIRVLTLKQLILFPDPGYALLNWIIGHFTEKFYVFMQLYGALGVILLYVCLKRLSIDVSTSFLVFIMQQGFPRLCSEIRQVFATLLVFYGVSYLLEKRWKKWVLFTGLAGTFHATAAIGFLYKPIVFTKHKFEFMVKIVFSFFCFLAITSLLIPIVVTFYKTNDYSSRVVAGEGRNLFLFVFTILVLIGYLFRKQSYSIHNRRTIAYNACIFGLVVQVLSFGFSLLNRLTAYYWIFAVILAPYILLSLKKSERFLLVSLLLPLSFLWFVKSLIVDSSGIVPYLFFFQ